MTNSRRQLSTALKLGLATGLAAGWMFAVAPEAAQAQSLALTGYKQAVAESLSARTGAALAFPFPFPRGSAAWATAFTTAFTTA